MKKNIPLSETLETGDYVKNDQTITLRVHHAKRKVRGKLASQCAGGCGAYLTEEEKASHECPGPPKATPQPKQSKNTIRSLRSRIRKTSTTDWFKKKIRRGRRFRRAMRKADAEGKLREFLDNC